MQLKRRVIVVSLVVAMFFGSMLMQTNVAAEQRGKELEVLQVRSLPGDRITGTYKKDSRTIYFEAERAEMNSDHDPDAPLYGLDIIVLDGNHVPFVVQTAGHNAFDQKWQVQQRMADESRINANDRFLDFKMLPDMAKALMKYNRAHPQKYLELKQVVSLLLSIGEEDHHLSEAEVSKDMAAATAAVTTYNHKITIRKKKAFNVVKDHSAVVLRVYKSTGALLNQLSTCNHGSCATDSSMSDKCSKTFVKSNVNTYMWDLMCDYYGSPFLAHLCNTDTLQQYLSTKGSSSMNWGVCWTPRVDAPNCD